MTSTRTRLLHLARIRFNERGLEGVRVRDLARELALSPGNVSYHFPRKEDLIVALMGELRDLNNETLIPLSGVDSIDGFLSRYRTVFRNQYEYRFLPRSLGTILKLYAHAAKQYRRTEFQRRKQLTETLAALREVGQLDRSLDEDGIACIVGVCTLIARFWLSEYEIQHRQLDVDRAIEHYIALIAHALLPYVAGGSRSPLARHVKSSLSVL